MEILTEAQRRFLRAAASVDPVRDSFWLTGGTALAAYYLGHRLSEDLDFFTATPHAVPLAVHAIRDPLAAAGFEITVVRDFPTFAELSASGHGEVLKIDLAEDTPFRLAPTRPGAAEGVALDSLEDISANKLSALFGRSEPKDFVDVYFLTRERAPLEVLVGEARRKHLGIDDYWLAQAYARARHVNVLPRMVRAVDLEEMRSFFLAEAERLMRGVAT
jgi:hypothetical protein